MVIHRRLAFLFPFIGLLNLFTHVLRDPTGPSVQTDIGLLDMAAGYFGYLDYSTMSQFSVSFAKDVTQLARTAVEKSKRSHMAYEKFPASLPSTSTHFNSDSQLSDDVGLLISFQLLVGLNADFIVWEHE